MKYEIKITTRFKRDYKIALKRGCSREALKNVVQNLADGVPLDPRYKDHTLSGRWANYRECHISPDWLLIYRVDDDVLILTLVRTGSHSDLFK